ncbi:MAG TPA: hotdog fold thioesterase [Bacteroidia bacterium]|nr:hotdog fold thioesterase [Bacteroidia bacterium]
MNTKELAEKVFRKMFDNDPFSQWLGIECLEIDKGKCSLKMTVRNEMLNGFSIAHGGVCYALADSALAFASNSHGIKSVSIETSISHTESVKEGDEITAVAKEIHLGNKTGIYHITVTNQHNKKVALFKGTVYRTGKEWFVIG